MPAVVSRAQCQVMWCAEAKVSGRRASGAGGAQQQGLAHLQRLKMFQSLQAAGPCGVFKLTLVFFLPW